MTIYYFEQGFYDDAFNEIPKNAVEISEEFYFNLLTGQARGKQILEDEKGRPILGEAQPTAYHTWNRKTKIWEISAEKQAELLIQCKMALLSAVATKTDRLKSAYLSGYSQAEIDSFYRQEREARGELPLMILTEIFEGRNDLTDVEQLKAKVIEKADLFAIIMGKTFAVKQGFEVKIEQAKTLDELDQINKEIEQWQSI